MTTQSDWKILLVDDDPESRELMADWLSERGYHPVAVADGDAATEIIQEGVAVIVTDLDMPRTDGFALLELAKERAPHAVVIVVSAVDSVDAAVHALKAGADDFIPKPINLNELN